MAVARVPQTIASTAQTLAPPHISARCIAQYRYSQVSPNTQCRYRSNPRDDVAKHKQTHTDLWHRMMKNLSGVWLMWNHRHVRSSISTTKCSTSLCHVKWRWWCPGVKCSLVKCLHCHRTNSNTVTPDVFYGSIPQQSTLTAHNDGYNNNNDHLTARTNPVSWHHQYQKYWPTTSPSLFTNSSQALPTFSHVSLELIYRKPRDTAKRNIKDSIKRIYTSFILA